MSFAFQSAQEAVQTARFGAFSTAPESFQPRFSSIWPLSSGPPCQEGEAVHVVNQIGHSDTSVSSCHTDAADDPFAPSEHPSVNMLNAYTDTAFGLIGGLLATVKFPSAAPLLVDKRLYPNGFKLKRHRLPVIGTVGENETIPFSHQVSDFLRVMDRGIRNRVVLDDFTGRINLGVVLVAVGVGFTLAGPARIGVLLSTASRFLIESLGPLPLLYLFVLLATVALAWHLHDRRVHNLALPMF